jgi:iduronate 2-sulfatase
MKGLLRREAMGVGVIATAAVVWTGLVGAVRAAERGGRYNVLFIAVDDLRPQLGCYGDKLVRSPHIDRLAAAGMVFRRAYCQQAVCSPSRTSLMTGRRPDTTRVYDLQTHFRKYLPHVVALPEQFKKRGYHCQSFGKIYHGGFDDPQSWSAKAWFPQGGGYGKPENVALMQRNHEEARRANQKLKGKIVLERDPKTGLKLRESARKRKPKRGPSWEDPDVPDGALRDGMVANEAIKTLRKIKDKPFFLAVGFYKPHLPFVAPKKYYDLYAGVELPAADNPYPPKGAPAFALHNSGELRNYMDIPKRGKIPESKARELVRGYYACVSYTDAQIGRVIGEVDRLGLRDKTVIILWGDHGWQLGEHGLWCKHTNFETSAHAPLIISVPGQKNAGARTDALVEFVDIYPSLCDICGVPRPDGLEGASFKPLLDDPKRPWKRGALSQYPRGVPDVGRVMGYSIRTDRYRLTEWADEKKGFRAVELYDHNVDAGENVNVANKPENAKVVEELTKLLHGGWQKALPPGVSVQ